MKLNNTESIRDAFGCLKTKECAICWQENGVEREMSTHETIGIN